MHVTRTDQVKEVSTVRLQEHPVSRTSCLDGFLYLSFRGYRLLPFLLLGGFSIYSS